MDKKSFAYIALAIVCIFWGTTYLAIRIGVESFPPFLFASIRQIAAGVLLFLLIYIFGKNEKLTLKDITRQAIPGVLLITFGNHCWLVRKIYPQRAGGTYCFYNTHIHFYYQPIYTARTEIIG